MIESWCHCDAVRLEMESAPEEVTDCNCTICRRYGALWAYYPLKDVRVTNVATDIYMWNKREIEFHRRKHCGCVTHYKSHHRIGVNARLMAPEVLARARVRPFDGADSRKYLD